MTTVGYDRILVPLDGSPRARAGLGPARRLARCFDAALWLVTIAGRDGPDDPEAVLDDARRAVGAAPVEIAVVPGDDPANAIATLDRDHPEALCCFTTRGRHPFVRGLLGSVASTVVERSDQAVVLVGPACDLDADRPIGRLTVALDGTPEAEVLLPWVERWRAAAALPTDIVHVVYPRVDPAAAIPPTEHEVAELAYATRIALALEGDGAAPVRPHTVQASDPAVALGDHVASGLPGVVMVAARRSSPGRDAVFGSTVAALVRSSPVPVVVVSRPDRARP